MAYILENVKESDRLEKQNQMKEYCILEEFKQLNLPKSKHHVLDAGCGSGTLSRAIFEIGLNYQVDACDFSQVRLQQAKQLSHQYPINYFQADLTNIQCQDNTYDMIFIRFVLEHVQDPLPIIKELHRILKPKGKIIAIDLDGLLFNLYPCSTFVNQCLLILKDSLPIDLHIGRKMPYLFEKSGFKIDEINIQPLVFWGDNFENECQQMEMRLNQSYPLIEQVLKEKTDKFIHEYMVDFNKVRFSSFSKFLVKATK